MGHIVNSKDEVYRTLAERLNRNPVGAPLNDTLMKILHRLYTEREAMVGSQFSLMPMTLEQIVGITGIEAEKLKAILDGMADKGLVLDIPRKEVFYYMLAPMVVGFFEYTFMRVRTDIDMRELAGLFEQYFGSGQVREEFSGAATKMMRTLVYESLVPLAVQTETLTYERASEIIRQSGGGAISMCACRHKAEHLGKSCGAPMDVCTSLGKAAGWIVHRGLGRAATVDELLRVLDQTESLGLVHLCDNVLSKPTYICHCCGCCCMILRGINEHGKFATHPSDFIPTLDSETCTGCGICADRCHIRAIFMHDPGNGTEVPAIKEEICIGCGVCASACPSDSLTMSRRASRYVPPEDMREKMLRIAREKGRI